MTRTTAIGLAALACWAWHASYYIVIHRPENLLWGCLVALPLAGVGTLARARWLVGPAALLLAVGLPLWIIDVASGSPPVRGSLATHVGGPILSLAGARAVGLPRGAGLAATGLLLALLGAARLLGTPGENVNLAFAVHPSARPYVASHAVYIVLLTAGLGAAFCAVEVVLRRLGWPEEVRR